MHVPYIYIYVYVYVYMCILIFFCSESLWGKEWGKKRGETSLILQCISQAACSERPSCPEALWLTQGLPGLFLWSLIKWGLLSWSSQPGSVPAVPPWLAAKLGVLYFPLGLPSPTLALIPVATLPLWPLRSKVSERRLTQQNWQVGAQCSTIFIFHEQHGHFTWIPCALPLHCFLPNHFRLRLVECLGIGGQCQSQTWRRRGSGAGMLMH